MSTEYKLYELTDEHLDAILALNEEEEEEYISTLIMRFYEQAGDRYEDLFISYRASFALEKLYRTNEVFQEGFRAIYTKTGMIRNIINDLYYADDDLIIH
jgi:hypothetical protein